MRTFIRERFDRDLAALTSARGNADIPGLVAAWSRDSAWMARAAATTDDAGLAAELSELGAEAFRNDAGHYASELRSHTDTLDAWWPAPVREQFLERHTRLLFMSAADPMTMARYRDHPGEVTVDIEGLEMLLVHRASGRGVLLLGVNQGHPGPAVFHPALRDMEIGIIQHTPGMRGPVALTPDGRVRLLPASIIGCRHARALLLRGQCVLVANDFVFEGVPAIRSRLFGNPVLLSRALVALALRTNCVVVPASYERLLDEPVRRHVVSFFPDVPIDALQGGDMSTAALALGLVSEALIRRSPENWRLWNTLADRWRIAAAAA